MRIDSAMAGRKDTLNWKSSELRTFLRTPPRPYHFEKSRTGRTIMLYFPEWEEGLAIALVTGIILIVLGTGFATVYFAYRLIATGGFTCA